MENQKEMLLDMIRAYEFAAVELNLYLDSHPDNQKALNDYNILVSQIAALKDEYEKIYGPLLNFGFGKNVSKERWQWLNDPWPWEYF
ncbi:MAG: spore coat protein CotJB [Caldicoprobacterales bacterium]|nr:spore coat protein CotJB [Clostridiales bacterium]